MLKKLFAKIKEMNTVRGTIYHYTAHFTTIDGKEHSFNKYRYGAPDKLKCSVPEYIMIDVKSDGYLVDNDGTMYPLQNVVSISWECDDVIENVILREHQVFYDKPLDKLIQK